MEMVYNNTGTVYKYVRDSQTKISSYQKGTDFNLNIQPVSQKEGFSWATLLKTSKMYTLEWGIAVWDKIIIDNVAYIVNYKQKRESQELTYFKYYIEESEWS